MTTQQWAWWSPAGQVVQVLAQHVLFDVQTADVYVPAQRRMHTVELGSLTDLRNRRWTQSELGARLLTLRILSLAATGAPVAAGHLVELLPHQTSILQRAVGMDPVRLAVCCEVGLGKTTTAGAVISELLARDRICRVLVVAPKGVQLQWVAEMRDKFALEFTRIGPEGIPIDNSADLWRAFSLVVTSVDAIKPLRRRSGWDRERVDSYNAARVDAVTAAGWDLVVIDEAHHVAGSAEDVARHLLATNLTSLSRNVMLLTATPHSGKSESFRRFLTLIEPDFASGREITASTVAAVLARTDKRTAVDNAGRPLFRPRTTTLDLVSWADHPEHRNLYELVSEYVREGYLHARSSGDNATGFLMLLFQRLVASSAAAVLAALERRRVAVTLRGQENIESQADHWDELGAGESELLLHVSPSATDVEALDVLIEAARSTLSSETDPKAIHFLRLLRRLRRLEDDPDVKILVFTQFRATQQMIVRLLDGQGISTATVDGTMGLAERASAQARFRSGAQVLISTDAGGEGVNLQFAHVVVNWDLPWTPTLIEQRIGRVDRIGQERDVRAINFVLEDSVDQRVVEVLESKLDLILTELGVDKRADVLATADHLAEDLYVSAIIDPDTLAAAAMRFNDMARAELDEVTDTRAILDDVTVAPPPFPRSPVPELVGQLNGLGNDSAKDALRSSSVVVPGEPVPLVRETGMSGWLAVGRVSTHSSPQLPSGFAVAVSDNGGVESLAGQYQLEVLTGRFGAQRATLTRPIDTVELSEDVHQTLTRALIDYSYHHLKKLGGGEVPSTPSVRLALALRLEL